MKPSPFQWAKISKEVNSMSDVITAAYVNQFLTEDPNDDFGTADLSEGWELTRPTLTAKLPPSVSAKYFRAGDRIVHKKPLAKSCTCGAQKTYGPTCSRSFHSSWCDLK
jgi:hypothetical protein